MDHLESTTMDAGSCYTPCKAGVIPEPHSSEMWSAIMAHDPADCRKEAALLLQRARTAPPVLCQELVELAEVWMKRANALERDQQLSKRPHLRLVR